MSLPEILVPALQSAHDSWKKLNPNYEIKYWSYSDCLKYLESEDKIYFDTFKSLKPYAYKCDFFRYYILYKQGGFYSDWKQKCIVPLDYINKNNTEWISCFDTGNGYSKYYECMGNGFLGSIPNHPILKSSIEQIIKNVDKKFYGSSCLDPTGPFVLGNSFKANKNQMKNYIIGNFDWDNYFSFDNLKVVQHKCDGVRTDQYWENGNNYVEMWVTKQVY